MVFPCANPQCNKEYNNKRSLHLHYRQSPLCNPSSHSFPVGNAGPFGDFDLSDMDLSLTSLCEGSNNLRESLMDISFPLTSDSSCVGSAGSGSSGGSSDSGSSVGISVGSGISGIGSGGGVGVSGGSSSVSSSSGRGVGSGGSKGGSINNSIEGRGSVVVVVVVADPPPDIDSDSDSDDKFFDALSNSHCVECQIEYLGSCFDHCDLDSESGQSSNESELDDNGLDEFVEQNTVNKIYSPLTKRSQSITEHKCKSCTKNTNSYMRFYLIPIHKPS